ncbi:MAG: phosphatase PAP2 family protein [Deltaproteobacteria bacterium]|nr:phosphatase PAP2 family protein [Deltaproteobacteria bacterium]
MLIDYGLVAAGTGTFLAMARSAPPAGSGIGPSFDKDNPSKILDPTYSDRLGRSHVAEDKGERVPALWVGMAIVPAAGWVLAQEGLGRWKSGDQRALRIHESGVGLAETLALTLMTNEVLKQTVGRLRPDFQDRVRRHYCAQPDSKGVACTGTEGGPLHDDPAKAQRIFDDGRKSFPSGHAATSFALATYAALATGGRWVWGDEATANSRAIGLGAQAAAMGLASYVAWSRVRDGRHNPSDVLTGATIGAVFANLAYWRRFDTHGETRRGSKPATSAQTGVQLAPLSLTVTWNWR